MRYRLRTRGDYWARAELQSLDYSLEALPSERWRIFPELSAPSFMKFLDFFPENSDLNRRLSYDVPLLGNHNNNPDLVPYLPLNWLALWEKTHNNKAEVFSRQNFLGKFWPRTARPLIGRQNRGLRSNIAGDNRLVGRVRAPRLNYSPVNVRNVQGGRSVTVGGGQQRVRIFVEFSRELPRFFGFSTNFLRNFCRSYQKISL